MNPGFPFALRLHESIVAKVPSCTFATRQVRYTPGLGFADQAMCLIRGGPSVARANSMLSNTLLASRHASHARQSTGYAPRSPAGVRAIPVAAVPRRQMLRNRGRVVIHD